MDYEKMYKEALERMKSWARGEHPECFLEAQKAAEFIFPELAEFENEKIRKAIHIYLDWLDGRKDYAPKGEYSIKDMIAWLNKQGEKKPTETANWSPQEESNPNKKPQRIVSAEAKEAMYDKPSWSEEDNELSCFESALFTAFSYAWQSYLLGEEVNVKQWAKEQSKELLEAAKEELKGNNTAWSEEDESIALGIEQIVNCASLLNIAPDRLNKVRNWLKSLKDRVQPQSQWKPWSEDDIKEFKAKLQSLMFEWSNKKDNMGVCIDRHIDKLLSILCNHTQSQWKPSDEQIGVIEAVINNRSFQRRHLDSLYQDLKKLKG